MARKLTEKKRTEILDAAGVVFSKKDFHEVLTDEIASEAGVGKGTIYRYFRTKDELYFATLIHGFHQLNRSLAETDSKGDSPAERLLRLATEILSIFWNRRSYYMLLHRDQKLLESRERELRKARADLEHRIETTIEEATATGEFRRVDPRVAANLFLGMVRSFLFYRREADTIASCARDISDVFLYGVAKRNPS